MNEAVTETNIVSTSEQVAGTEEANAEAGE